MVHIAFHVTIRRREGKESVQNTPPNIAQKNYFVNLHSS